MAMAMDQQPELSRVRTVTEYNEWSNAEWINLSNAPATPGVSTPGSSGKFEQAVSPTSVLIPVLPLSVPLPPVTQSTDLAHVFDAAFAPSDVLQPALAQDAVQQQQQGQQQQQQQQPQDHVPACGKSRRGARPSSPESPVDEQLVRLLADMEVGGDAASQAVLSLRGRVRLLSLDIQGCRVVQKAIDVAPIAVAAELAAELQGHVMESVTSPHANYVIQKIVTGLPSSRSAFVAEELRVTAADVARHRFGCRSVIRLIEHTANEPSTAALIDELLPLVQELSCHKFAHHIVQSVLEHVEAKRHQVAMALTQQAHHIAKDHKGSYVMESAMTHCSADDQDALMSAIVGGGRDAILDLAKEQFGCFVVKSMMGKKATSTQRQLARTLSEYVWSAQGALMQTRGGERLFRELTVAKAAL